jgi:hypothetical protein
MIEKFPGVVGFNPDHEVQSKLDHFGDCSVCEGTSEKARSRSITHVRASATEVGIVPEMPALRKSMTPDLIFDIGLHRGEDTDFYLRKGFRVVAIEANPDLVSACQTRLGTALQSGRLHIIEGAIADPSASDAITFSRTKIPSGERLIPLGQRET